MLQRRFPAALSDNTRAVRRNTFVLAMLKGGEGRCHELENTILQTPYPCLKTKTVPVERSIGQIASTRRPTRVAEPNAQTTALGCSVVHE